MLKLLFFLIFRNEFFDYYTVRVTKLDSTIYDLISRFHRNIPNNLNTKGHLNTMRKNEKEINY